MHDSDGHSTSSNMLYTICHFHITFVELCVVDSPQHFTESPVCVYRCWINESRYTIVLIIPVCASMVLNLVFLCNILRVLLLKLRAGPRVGSSRPSSTLLQVCLSSRDPLPNHKSRTLVLHYIYLHLGLDDEGIGVRVPVGQEFLVLHVVQTGCGVHPTSYPMGTGGPFPGGKAAGA
jgi:hypothetical protein